MEIDMELGLKGKVAFVTGGSRGIGRATALRFAREGASVAFSYNSDKAAADETVAAIGDKGPESLAVRFDLADVSSMTAGVTQIRDRFGGIDIFVANAVQWASNLPPRNRSFEDVPGDEWTEQIRANLEGTIASLQAVLGLMRGRADARIVLVSSDVARHSFAGAGFYGASKAALTGLMQGLVAELRGDILVNIVSPGFTVTERNVERMPQGMRDAQGERTPTGRLSTPDDIARAVVFLGSPANRNITGETLSVTGGI
jgi:NAD(P)-dependent dehydrogenase (short-subunit alcohol dehydrogenase family)